MRFADFSSAFMCSFPLEGGAACKAGFGMINWQTTIMFWEVAKVKQVVVIDGKSGRTGQLFIERVKAAQLPCELLAIGTNAIATSAMLKAGADAGATGENPVVVACRKADVIVGPIGILAADSLMGEVTPTMAVAVGQSDAIKLLLPVSHCKNVVVGTETLTLSKLMDEAVELLRAQLNGTVCESQIG